MKRKILALAMAIAVIATMAVPMAVFAETDAVPLDGTLGSSITVTTPVSKSFSTFSVIDSPNPTTIVFNVSTTGASTWTVTAKDQNNGTNKGFMLKTAGDSPLNQPLQICDSLGGTYVTADTGIVFNQPNGDTTLYLKQVIGAGDLAGTYDIVIEFNSAVTG